MKKVLVSFVLSLVLLSCSTASKDTVDLRDSYVGTYSVKLDGTVNMMYSGEIAQSMPVSSDTTYTVTKVGTNQLNVGGRIATVAGTKLTFAAQTSNQSFSGYTMAQTINQTGTLSTNSIAIDDNYSGTWNVSVMGISMNGTLTGKVTETCTKK